MKLLKMLMVAAVVLAQDATAQMERRDPHIGYVYPAGGQQGSTVEVIIGGQAIGGASHAYVTGEGIHAASVQFVKPLNNEQLRELRVYVTGLMKARRGTQEGTPRAKGTPEEDEDVTPDVPMLLQHPLLKSLPNMSLPELEHWATQFLNTYRRQLNPQLIEMAVVELVIDANAEPGDRELRLSGRQGVSNPLRFQVGTMPEVREHEPNDQTVFDNTPLALPAVLNGQIMPGDADRFRFDAKAGSRFVIRAQARGLMPYLADAVPGWFQAALTVYDAAGTEMAFADHYRFEPDPVLTFKAPRDGEYEIEIRDTIYRGRQDFVYRIIAGDPATATRIPKETAGAAAALLPECAEAEPNNDTQHAQDLALPHVANGCIAEAGDVDFYRFQGHANEEVVAEIVGRRIGSPLDSLLRLMDESGRVIEWDDDYEDKASGLLTHHADSYLLTRLPAEGTYFLRVADTQRAGGEEYHYRLRVSAPQPDFSLRVSPSSINLVPGRFTAIEVHAIRKDGFDGDIEVVLEDAPAGFELSGGMIPGGRDSVRMTLAAPPAALDSPVELHMEGRAQIGGQAVAHPAVPSEDMMQAFANHHLVPSQQLLVTVLGPKRGATIVQLADTAPVRVPVGGEAKVIVRAPASPLLSQVRLALVDPPKGISIEGPTVVSEGLSFSIRSSTDAPGAGYRDNLIVQANLEPPAPAESAEPKAKQNKPSSFGVLPAIAYEVVSK